MNHIYFGDGKGKTTAAIGLAVRAAGAGKKVCFCQFMKGGDTSELDILRQIPGIEIMRCTREYPFYNQMSETDKKEIILEHNGMINKLLVYITLETASTVDKASAGSGVCGGNAAPTLIVLDEITYPLNYGLISKAPVYALLEAAHKNINDLEIVCTGRNPDDRLYELADYITEMKLHRHPFETGVSARAGIEF